MAISFIGANGGNPASATIPAGIQAGDYIIVFAYKNSTTAPSLATGYTNISTQSANTNSFRIGYKIAVGNETSTGTWTNASTVQVAVYRGVTGIGAAGSTTNAAATTTTIAGIGTMQADDLSSWVLSFAGSRQTTSMSTPSGTSLRNTQAGTTAMGIIVDTNGGVSSSAQKTSNIGASAAGVGGSVELRGILGSNINMVQSKASTTSGTVATINWTSNTTTGNLIVVGYTLLDSVDQVTSVTDSQGNTYTKITSASGTIGGSAGAYGGVWYSKNITGGTTPSITVTGGGGANINAVAMEFSGIDTVNPLDSAAVKRGVGTTASMTSGTSAATSASNELIVGVGHTDWGSNTFTSGTNYTGLLRSVNDAFVDVAMEYKVVTSTGTQTATMTSGNASDYSMALVPFIASSGAPSIPTNLFFGIF